MPEPEAARMYNDYLRLRSLRAVGKIYGRSKQALHEMFQRRGWPMYRKKHLDFIDYKGVRYTPHGSGGYYASTSGPKRVHLHRLIWEEANGPVPAGFQVHLVDGDKRNVDLKNLELRPINGRSTNPQGINGATKRFAEEMVEKHIGFVIQRAQRMATRFDVPIEDMIQCGRVAVFKAAHTYKKGQGANFLTWAAFQVRAEMQKWIAANKNAVRRPRNKLFEGSEISLDQPIAEDLTFGELLGVEEQVTGGAIDDEAREAIAEALLVLRPADREIIHRRFFENQTLQEIAEQRGVTREAIRQRILLAFRKLRRSLKQFKEAA